MIKDKVKIIQIASKVTEAVENTEPMHRATVLLSYLIEATKEAGLTKEELIFLVDNFFDHPKVGKVIFN